MIIPWSPQSHLKIVLWNAKACSWLISNTQIREYCSVPNWCKPTSQWGAEFAINTSNVHHLLIAGTDLRPILPVLAKVSLLHKHTVKSQTLIGQIWPIVLPISSIEVICEVLHALEVDCGPHQILLREYSLLRHYIGCRFLIKPSQAEVPKASISRN